MSFAHQMANQMVAARDEWWQGEVSKFKNACEAASRQGHSGVCHKTSKILEGFNRKELRQKMHDTVEGFGFSSTKVEVQWQRYHFLHLTVEWGSLSDVVEGQNKGLPQGGHAQLCSMANTLLQG